MKRKVLKAMLYALIGGLQARRGWITGVGLSILFGVVEGLMPVSAQSLPSGWTDMNMTTATNTPAGTNTLTITSTSARHVHTTLVKPIVSTGGTSSQYPATDGNILWDAGWETGDTSQWELHVGGHWGNSSCDVVTSPTRWGNYAGKLTLNPGQATTKWKSGHARAEITASQEHTGGYANQQWYYSFSVYFPSNPDRTTGWGDWTDFTQWMDMRAKCSPPLQFNVTPDEQITFHWEMTTQTGDCGYGQIPSIDYPLGPLVYDQWIDFTAYIKWSTNASVGFAQVWRNGKETLPLTHMQTFDPGGTGVYMEQAMYRPNTPGTSIIYIDGTRRHDAYQPYP